MYSEKQFDGDITAALVANFDTDIPTEDHQKKKFLDDPQLD